MNKKIKPGAKVRLLDGRTGEVLDYDKKTDQWGVQITTQGLWELIWKPQNQLKVTK